MLHDLGLEDQYCRYYKILCTSISLLKLKTSVGGTKQIKIDKIKALKPDIILCNKEENTKDIVEACQEICQVHVSDL